MPDLFVPFEVLIEFVFPVLLNTACVPQRLPMGRKGSQKLKEEVSAGLRKDYEKKLLFSKNLLKSVFGNLA